MASNRRPSRQAQPDQRSDAALRALAGFARLPAAALERLACAMSVERVPEKTVLVREGQVQEWLFVVPDGLLQQFTLLHGREATLAILEAPILAHPHAVQRASVSLCSLRTLTAARVGRIALLQARRLAAEVPEFAAAMALQVAAEHRNLLFEYKCARTRNGLERLAAWIVAMHDRLETCEIEVPFDKSVLAARLGVAPATLSRDFASLAAHGVTVRGRTLVVGDLQRLRDFARVEELNTPPVP